VASVALQAVGELWVVGERHAPFPGRNNLYRITVTVHLIRFISPLCNAGAHATRGLLRLSRVQT